MPITAKCPKDKLYKNITIRCNGVHLLLNLKVKSLFCLPQKSSFSRGNIKQYILKVRVIEKLPKLDSESSEKKKEPDFRFIYYFYTIYKQRGHASETYIPTNALLYTIMQQSEMLILKHLKTLQHVPIINQIIFRELVGPLLKSLNLKI